MRNENSSSISKDTILRKSKEGVKNFKDLTVSLQIWLLDDSLHFDDIQSLEFYDYPTERKVEPAMEIFGKYHFIKMCLLHGAWADAKENSLVNRFLKRYSEAWSTEPEDFYNSKLYAYLERGEVDWDKMYKSSGGIVKKERW